MHKHAKIYQVHNNVAYINIRSSQTISRLGNIVSHTHRVHMKTRFKVKQIAIKGTQAVEK